jgi:hypothetical protein
MYDVDATSATVTLKVFGRKVGNTLMVEDEAFREHQNDPTQPTGDGPDNDAQ